LTALDATNWRADQALPPAVVDRKISGRNRSIRGAQTQEILSRVIQTARLRDLHPRDVIGSASLSRYASPAVAVAQ
jgi:transposase